MIKSLSILAFVLSFIGLTAPAQAQTALERAVDRHTLSVDRIATATHNTMVRICDRTVRSVELLDSRGAANDRVTRVGDGGLVGIERLGDRQTLAVERASARLITLLERRGADAALIEEVNAATADAVARLEASVVETQAPITQAVETATTN